jgi:uncharacterized protein YdcH (DUF465 family)
MQQATENHAAELEKLLCEHRALDTRVNQLEQQFRLTADEELEIHQLKKLKLQKKDQIQRLRAGCN